MNDNVKFWDRVASMYTPLHERSNRILYEEVLERCRHYLKTGDEVLELACGTGQLTFPLYDRVRHWEATDFSEKMIGRLQKRMDRYAQPSMETKIHPCVQDATDLYYVSHRFDVVLMANALHILPDPDRALSEIRRVLKRKGFLIVPTFVYEGKLNRPRLWILEKAGFHTYHKWTLSGLRRYLMHHGFRIVESRLIPGTLLPEGFVVCRP